MKTKRGIPFRHNLFHNVCSWEAIPHNYMQPRVCFFSHTFTQSCRWMRANKICNGEYVALVLTDHTTISDDTVNESSGSHVKGGVPNGHLIWRNLNATDVCHFLCTPLLDDNTGTVSRLWIKGLHGGRDIKFDSVMFGQHSQ